MLAAEGAYLNGSRPPSNFLGTAGPCCTAMCGAEESRTTGDDLGSALGTVEGQRSLLVGSRRRGTEEYTEDDM